MNQRRLLRLLCISILIAVCGGSTFWAVQLPQEADRLFGLLQLKAGSTVGEVGSGRGEMMLEMANRVGSSGRVFANELDPARLRDLRNAVASRKTSTITIVEGAEASINFPVGCCDAIFMRDVYHHLTKPAEINASILAALKPGGLVAIIDFEPRGNMSQPQGVPANREGHGIRPEIVVDEMTAAGFRVASPKAEWPTTGRGGARMFVVLLRKP